MLGKRSAPPVAELYATLREQGRNRVMLDVWLASDHTLRKVRPYSAALELVLLDGTTSVVEATAEYWDFGVRVDISASPDDQMLGYPAERHWTVS
jgi:hypothetical protein